MKNIVIAFRSLFKKGRHNDIKILSLGVGLAMGLVLIAKVCFEVSYDNFYPDSGRIYQIRENMVMGDRKAEDRDMVSNAIAPGMKAEIPGVEASTRLHWRGPITFLTSDKKQHKGDLIFADSCLFDVLPRKMLTGDAREILARPLYVLVSESMAKRLDDGGDVVGMSLEMTNFPGHKIVIGGVFEDLPENSHLKYDVALSLSSFKTLYGWSNEGQWLGGDSYMSYVKAQPGLSRDSLQAEMEKMLDRHVDPAKLKEMGLEYTLTLKPLNEVYATSPATKSMAVMLLLIAFAVLFAALMNYILLVISSLVTRSKDIAVHKCYGASGWNISEKIFSETFLNLLASLILSALLILGFREMVEELLNASLGGLFTMNTILLLVLICGLIFLLAGLLPSRLFIRIPVAAAFRSYTESRRYWKKALLFIQFIAVGFLVALLTIIGLQYHRMVTDDPGYSYDRLAYCKIEGGNSSTARVVMDEIRKLPEVQAVAASTRLPITSGNGNMLFKENLEETILHIEDLQEVNADFIPLMQIPVIQGKAFDNTYSDSSRVVMISKATADKLSLILDWKEGVVGKKLYVSGHGMPNDYEIIGVYGDVRVGAINSEASEPTVMFYSNNPYGNIITMKLSEMTVDNLKRVEETIQALFPDKDINVVSYEVSIVNMYAASRLFRNSVMTGGLITLLIALIGLIGYINDETIRRSKEIAIRKINGATVNDILTILSLDTCYMSVPAIAVGVVGAYWMGEHWLQQFSDKIPLHFLIFVGSALFIWLIILTTVIARTWSIAVSNPVDSLKSE